MQNIKVSIIIPCYNVEQYLEQCLNSVINQTLKDIEIIVINDGSTDGTGNIIRGYAAREPRIRVIDKPNSGYGDSMNKGFAAAKGEYIGIVESDDFAEPEMFETLYNTAAENNADVVKSNFWFYWSNPERNELHEYFQKNECNSVIVPSRFDGGSLFGRKPSIWSAIYKRSFIEKNNISFLSTPGASYQDTSFTFKVYSKAERMVCLYDAFLHYRQDNENSSVNNADKKIEFVFKEYAEIEGFLLKSGEKDYLFPIYATAFYDTCIWLYERLTPAARYPFLRRVSPMFRTLIKKVGINKLKFGDMWWKKRDILRISQNPYEYHMWRNDERYAAELSDTHYPLPRTPLNNISEIIAAQELKQHSPRFSVIVPVYNVERYLPSALDSLLYQTEKDIEIICVNDGSTDHSLSILESYAKLDERIIIINRENGGLSAARNSGLSAAAGEYIIFLDSDDHLAENACERLNDIIKKYQQPNAVEFGTTPFPSSPAPGDWLISALNTPNKYYERVDEKVLLTTPHLKPVFCWRYCWKNEFIKTNSLKFDEKMRYGEDAIFLFEALTKVRGLAVASDKLYFYRHVRDDSLMNNARNNAAEFPAQQLKILEESLSVAVSNGFPPSAELLEYSCDFVWGAISACPQPQKSAYIEAFMKLMENYGLSQYETAASGNCRSFFGYCKEVLESQRKERSIKVQLRHFIAKLIPPSRKIFYEHSSRIIDCINSQQQSISLLQQQLSELQMKLDSRDDAFDNVSSDGIFAQYDNMDDDT